jgi:glutamate-1-semialdehyde aminotransferase
MLRLGNYVALPLLQSFCSLLLGVYGPVGLHRWTIDEPPTKCTASQGPYCFDVDGNKYIDYIGSWGPAIVGAANDEVNAALHTQIDKGTSFGAPCELEVRLWWCLSAQMLPPAMQSVARTLCCRLCCL